MTFDHSGKNIYDSCNVAKRFKKCLPVIGKPEATFKLSQPLQTEQLLTRLLMLSPVIKKEIEFDNSKAPTTIK